MHLETVEQIVTLLSQHPVSEITLEREGLRVVARKPLTAALSAPASSVLSTLGNGEVAAEREADTTSETPLPEPLLLTSGLVGLFRHAEPPVGYGARLTPGQIVGSIEAMKVLNDVRVEMGGQVVDVFVEEGAPVEYGQTLFRLMPE